MPAKDPSVDKRAVKALVAVYGPREASRQSGIPYGTIQSWCFRYKWHKARGLSPAHTALPKAYAISGKDAADAIADAMAEHKAVSSVKLAQFTANAAKKAAAHPEPLTISKAVADVARVYKAIYPPEREEGMIEAAILVGDAPVTENHTEMLAHVREELSDPGSAGD